MILFRRLLPLLTGIALFLGFEVFFARPNSLFVTGSVMVALLVMSIVALARSSRRRLWTFLFAPVLLVVGTLLFVLFPEQGLLRHGLALLAAGMVWNDLEQLFAFHYGSATYQAFALENISFYINIANVFLIVSGLFGLRYYIGTSLLVVLPVIFSLLFLATFHTLTMSKVEGRARLTFTVLVSLLGFEVVMVLALLPSDLYVNGLLTATIFYVLVSLTHYHLRSTLDRSRIRRYVLLGSVVIVLTILTAAWR